MNVPPVNMMPSAYKHGFEIEDAVYLMANPVAAERISQTDWDEVWAYVGYPYDGSDRKVELLARHIAPRTIEVFHFMDLTDIWRHLWKEGR